MSALSNTILIFPKLFELYGFLADCGEDFENITYKKVEFENLHYTIFYLSYKIEESYVILQCYTIDSSDIEFLFAFINFVNYQKDLEKKLLIEKPFLTGSNTHYILMGTAGSATSKSLGSSFIVSNAHKIDRGDLEMDGTKLVVSFTNDAPMATSSILFRNHILSTNYVAHCHPKDMYALADNDWLIDMETYEFLKICETFKLKSACIRIVSDVYGNDSSSSTRNAGRKCLKFATLLPKLREVVDILGIYRFPHADVGFNEKIAVVKFASKQREANIKKKFNELIKKDINLNVDHLKNCIKQYVADQGTENCIVDIDEITI